MNRATDERYADPNLPSSADLDAHQADETARAATAVPQDMRYFRPVRQLVFVSDTEHAQGIFAVICEDGTMWERVRETRKTAKGNVVDAWFVWKQIEPPPEKARNQ